MIVEARLPLLCVFQNEKTGFGQCACLVSRHPKTSLCNPKLNEETEQRNREVNTMTLKHKDGTLRNATNKEERVCNASQYFPIQSKALFERLEINRTIR